MIYASFYLLPLDHCENFQNESYGSTLDYICDWERQSYLFINWIIGINWDPCLLGLVQRWSITLGGVVFMPKLLLSLGVNIGNGPGCFHT